MSEIVISVEAFQLVCKLPQIKISYCVKCKWSLRAVWYQQEILQTYTNNPKFPHYHIPEISLVPSLTPGTFKVEVFTDIGQLVGKESPYLIWERKRDGGFPDSKILKQKIRDILFPGGELGHVDGHKKENGDGKSDKGLLVGECVECKENEQNI